MTGTGDSPLHGATAETNGLTRRRLLQTGGVFTITAAIATAVPSMAFGRGQPGVDVENLGPGVFAFTGMGARLVGDTMWIGSRNLDPTRVVGFHVPTGQVTQTFTLGNGNFVEGVAADGAVLYAGVTHAADQTNLYRCDLLTGEVTGVAAVPGLFIRDLAVAPDGIVYVVGRPRPTHGDGPPIYSYDPASGDLIVLAVPEPEADQGYAIDVTDTTVYYGCDSTLTDRTGSGLFAVDRASGAVTKLRDGAIVNRGIAVLGDVVAVGGQPLTGENWFGVLDLATGDWREVEIPARAVGRHGDDLIVHSNGELLRLDPETLSPTRIGSPDNGALGRAGLVDDLVVGATQNGLVWTFDLASGETELHDLIGAGASGDAMLGMSVGAGDGLAYVGGTGHVAVHDLTTGSATNVQAGAEVKDMIWVGGVMYMGVYPRAQLWEHRPSVGTPPQPVAQLPEGHNRPHVVRWDDVHQLVLVGAENDAGGGGSLSLFDPATGSLTPYVNPLGGGQFVRAVASGQGLVYIGGSGDGGDLAALDPLTGREVWRLGNPFGQNVSSLVVLGRRLFGTTTQTRFFVIDLAGSPEVTYQANFSAVTSNNARLVVDRGLIYGASARSLFRVDPVSFEPTVLADDLDGEWFSGPRLASDSSWLYTLAGRDLIRIRDRSPRDP